MGDAFINYSTKTETKEFVLQLYCHFCNDMEDTGSESEHNLDHNLNNYIQNEFAVV